MHGPVQAALCQGRPALLALPWHVPYSPIPHPARLFIFCRRFVLQEASHAEIIRALKVEQAKELPKLRQEFELQARELGSKYEKKMKMLRDDLELRRKQEIHEIEEHKVGGGGRVLYPSTHVQTVRQAL